MDTAKLDHLRAIYGSTNANSVEDAGFAEVQARIGQLKQGRSTPYSGISTLLGAPFRQVDWEQPDFSDLQVALLGVPMDLAVSNRNGSRFGPRAVRTIERIGPYNHALRCVPLSDLRVADIGDIPLRSSFTLEMAHEAIERHVAMLVGAGVAPLSVGGDHSIDRPILRAIGKERPVGLIHIDAHCDTGGNKFSHGGPFRQAVLDGVLDPDRTVQIGIRGPSEYFWEFSYRSGMTVIHAEEIDALGMPAVIEKARSVVGDGPTYLSFDIDALDPAFAPGTGTPEIGGLTTREAQALLRGLKGINFVGGDVVEIAPQYDATTNTAMAGAQILFEILSLFVFSPSITESRASNTTSALALVDRVCGGLFLCRDGMPQVSLRHGLRRLFCRPHDRVRNGQNFFRAGLALMQGQAEAAQNLAAVIENRRRDIGQPRGNLPGRRHPAGAAMNPQGALDLRKGSAKAGRFEFIGLELIETPNLMLAHESQHRNRRRSGEKRPDKAPFQIAVQIAGGPVFIDAEDMVAKTAAQNTNALMLKHKVGKRRPG